MHDLKVWPDVEADIQGDQHTGSKTPGKTKDRDDQMTRLAKV